MTRRPSDLRRATTRSQVCREDCRIEGRTTSISPAGSALAKASHWSLNGKRLAGTSVRFSCLDVRKAFGGQPNLLTGSRIRYKRPVLASRGRSGRPRRVINSSPPLLFWRSAGQDGRKSALYLNSRARAIAGAGMGRRLFPPYRSRTCA